MADCDQFQADLIPYAEQEGLDDDRFDAVHDHIASCDACRETVESYQRITNAAALIREGEDTLEDIGKRVDTNVARVVRAVFRIRFDREERS